MFQTFVVALGPVDNIPQSDFHSHSPSPFEKIFSVPSAHLHLKVKR